MTDSAGASTGVEVEWQFDAIDLRPVERWLARLNGAIVENGNHPSASAQGESALLPPGATPTGPGDAPATSATTHSAHSAHSTGHSAHPTGASAAAANGASPPLVASARPTKRLIDTYMDTEDWRVGRCGYVLRFRRSAGLGEATLKDTAPATNGLRKRVEITELLPREGMAALGTDGPVGRRVQALAGNRALRPVLEVRTTRRPFDLRRSGEKVAEIALDETVISAGEGERPTRLRRVEVEVVPAWAKSLAPLVEELRKACGLQPATLSKFEAGLLAAGLEVPGPPDLGPTQVTESSTIGELAYAVIRRNMAAMLAHEPGTRLGEDAEDLHDMRVATRRMRAAISLFKEVLPVRAQNLREDLGWLAGKLGAVRDLDVQIERLGQWVRDMPEVGRGSLSSLSVLLEEERAAARSELLAGLESARYERLVAGMSAMLRQGPPRRGAITRAPASAVVPDLVSSRQRSAAKAARRARGTGKPEDFHRLRIRCKRLRYALEFVSELYQGHTSKMVRRVTRLQDMLGLMQDAVVAVERLQRLATNPESGLPPETVFAMGAVGERYRADAARISSGLPAHLNDLKGARWQKLKGLMEHRRLEIAALYRWPLQPRSQQTGPDTANGNPDSTPR